MRGGVRIVFEDAVGQHCVLSPEGYGAVSRRAQSRVQLLERLARDTRIEVGGLVGQGAAIVLGQGLRRVAEVPGGRIEEGFGLEQSRPVPCQGLGALQAEPRLGQVVRCGTRTERLLFFCTMSALPAMK